MEPIRSILSDESWLIRQKGFKKEEDAFYETIFSLSNGYIGVRHTLNCESEQAIPGCFLADVYDVGVDVHSQIVNLPNWLSMSYAINGRPLHFYQSHVLNSERVLDLRQALVYAQMLLHDEAGQSTFLEWAPVVHATRREVAL